MLKQKIIYLLTSTFKRITSEGNLCPSCGSKGRSVVDKKYIVTSLVRCESCSLLYRTPTTSIKENYKFYQQAYTQGVVTDLPTDSQLEALIADKFKNNNNEYIKYIEILEAIGCKKGDKLFDFGSSWGYGSWLFKQYGFDVQSFEISNPRAEFARTKLGLDVFESMEKVEGPYDIFFSSHVLEHVPSVLSAIEEGFRLLRPGGIFVAITPNGSADFRAKNSNAWSKLWGNVHPQFLDDVYYKKQFLKYPYILDSSPYKINELKQWGQVRTSPMSLDLSGGNLLCAVIKD